MKLLVCGDVHWSESSSIVKAQGIKYTKRLENLIESINWVEREAENNNVDMIIYLGDFFDRASLTAMEITALNDITWSKNIWRVFLVGNHDSNTIDLKYSTTECLRSVGEIINKPTIKMIEPVPIVLIPYIKTNETLDLKDYIGNTKMPIVFAHQDIAGLHYGTFTSTSGFSIDDIDKNCSLFIDGHLHNSIWVNNKLLLAGNLTGQNFTEDAEKYRHSIWLLDTEDPELKVKEIQNPYAIKFFKISDLNKLQKLDKYSVVSVTVPERLERTVKELVKDCLASRILFSYEEQESDSEDIISADDLKVEDHIKLFIDYSLETLPNTKELNDELILLGETTDDSEI